MELDNTKEPIESIENLEEKIEQQVDNIIRESEQIHDQEDMYTPEYTYMPETPWSGHNGFSIVLKVISSLIMLAGVSIGLAAILTANDSKIAFMSLFAGIWILVGSTVFFLFFYGLGEIISILHDMRNNQ